MAGRAAFPDRPHFEQLADYLWAKKGPGAVVLVGAGFSRNAISATGSGDAFPTWDELGLRLMKELDRSDHDEVGIRQAVGGVNVARLAGEYEAAFGQAALERLLLTAIPDEEFVPGELHELLLSLPWKDVFTTNYDTLLERTRPRLTDRKYDIVYTPNDIPASEAPRIVKLHGSFPSTRPWIVTDEHYRQYSVTFAPFVNLVQQAMMENALCLIGFSGDDQNFLYWTGWVRDVLGAARLPVYLLTLDVSATRRAWLENRNVVPIDLGPMFPTRGDGSDRHRRAMEWALRSLHANQPWDQNRWPNMGRLPQPASSEVPELPPLAVSRARSSAPQRPRKRSLSRGETLTENEIQVIDTYWRWLRESYPGWIIAPSVVRADLAMEIQMRADDVLRSLANIPLLQQLAVIHALNWLLDITLTPLNTDWTAEFERILDRTNPCIAATLESPDHQHRQAKEPREPLSAELLSAWMNLAFALMRHARETGQGNRFKSWQEKLEPIVRSKPDWMARWCYERALFAISSHDDASISAAVADWPSGLTNPTWTLRRAGLLAQMERFDEARRQAEDLLSKIRQQLTADPENRFLMSLEGWTMLLVWTLDRRQDPFDSDSLDHFRNRWDVLEAYRCNPRTEFDFFRSKLKSDPPEPSPPRRTQVGFDPGTLTISRRWSVGTWFAAIDAFRFLRLIEEVGLPPKIGPTAAAVARAAVWIQPYDPERALGLLIRSGVKQDIETFFDRIRVAVIPQEQINLIYDLAIRECHGVLAKLDIYPPGKLGNEDVTYLESNLEVLSRIAFRLDIPQLSSLLSFAVELSQRSQVQAEIAVYKALRHVFRRVLYAMPDRHVFERIGQLLDVPLYGEVQARAPFGEDWPDPFWYIDFRFQKQMPAEIDRKGWHRKIESLIEQAHGTARSRAIYRLLVLWESGVLTKQEEEAFCRAVWHIVDPASGLPSVKQFTAAELLRLPGRKEHQMLDKLRRQLLEMRPTPMITVRRQDGRRRFSVTLPVPSYEADILSVSKPKGGISINGRDRQFIDWSSDEVASLFGKIKRLWNAQKDGVKWYLERPFAPGEQRDFWPLIDVLATVLLPRASTDLGLEIVAVLDEMAELGINVLRGSPLILLANPSRRDEVVSRLLSNLQSFAEESLVSASFGIYNWCAFFSSGHLPPVPQCLLDTLISYAVLRRHPGVATALNVTAAVIEQAPSLLTEAHYRGLVRALAYLLDETALESLSGQRSFTGIAPADELPRLRASAARLAREVFDVRDQVGVDEAVLQRWKIVGETDVLPEVRYAWAKVR